MLAGVGMGTCMGLRAWMCTGLCTRVGVGAGVHCSSAPTHRRDWGIVGVDLGTLVLRASETGVRVCMGKLWVGTGAWVRVRACMGTCMRLCAGVCTRVGVGAGVDSSAPAHRRDWGIVGVDLCTLVLGASETGVRVGMGKL